MRPTLSLLLCVLCLAACAQTPNGYQAALSEKEQTITLPQTYALASAAPLSSSVPTSDCGRNVTDIITHLEGLMIQSVHIRADQVASR